ncbi:hypothetical protein [Ottowia thiooxydans]|uniref:hypothetical protein n=1 Tax=Ottowia thiooxydans TaxID=219182 RepID=UPI000404F732|nr:hypothetical protein [Ottowia thiooxydans]
MAQLPLAVIFALSCAVAMPAAAQGADAKRTLATKISQIQQKSDSGAMAEQLTASAVQPVIAAWSQRLDETVPPARQKEVRDRLDVELKKFAETTQKAIESQTAKAADATLVPMLMEKLSEDELKTIVTYLESSAAAKFQALGSDATNAWAKKVIDNTRTSVENAAKSFDAAANRIVGAPGAPAAGTKK